MFETKYSCLNQNLIKSKYVRIKIWSTPPSLLNHVGRFSSLFSYSRWIFYILEVRRHRCRTKQASAAAGSSCSSSSSWHKQASEYFGCCIYRWCLRCRSSPRIVISLFIQWNHLISRLPIRVNIQATAQPSIISSASCAVHRSGCMLSSYCAVWCRAGRRSNFCTLKINCEQSTSACLFRSTENHFNSVQRLSDGWALRFCPQCAEIGPWSRDVLYGEGGESSPQSIGSFHYCSVAELYTRSCQVKWPGKKANDLVVDLAVKHLGLSNYTRLYQFKSMQFEYP